MLGKNQEVWKMRNNVNEKRGFTLIELLVVISIIALLMAILVPALQKAKVTAEKIICGSNLHQLVLMCKMYSLDNDGCLPPASYNTWVSASDGHAMIGSWYYNQAKYFYDTYPEFCKVMSCPNIRKDGNMEAHIKAIRDGKYWTERDSVTLGYYYLGGIFDTPQVTFRSKNDMPWSSATMITGINRGDDFHAGLWPEPYPSNLPTFPASPIKDTDKGGLYLAADTNYVFGAEQNPFWGFVGDQLEAGDSSGLVSQMGHFKTGGGLTATRLAGQPWPDYRRWKIMPISVFAGSNHLYHDGHVEWKDWRELYARNYANFWALDESTRR